MKRAKTATIAKVGGGLITSWIGSTRIEIVDGFEHEKAHMLSGTPTVYVLWHGRLLPCSYFYRRFGFATLITQNRDGDLIAPMIERWGYRVIRGSTSRGGTAALREIVRTLRGGNSVALTPDGPRGPRQKMKLGPLLAAQIAGVPVVPVSAGATSGWYFGKWDRFLVPRPFTWVPLAVGAPMLIDRNASETDVEKCAEEMEVRLNNLTEFVDGVARAGHR